MVESGLIRSNQRLVNVIERLLDLGMVFFGLLIASVLHPDSGVDITAPTYAIAGILAAVLFYVVAAQTRLYQSWRGVELSLPVKNVLQTWGITVVTLFTIAWALKVSETYSRIVIGIWFLLTPCLLVTARVGIRKLLIRLRSAGRNSRSVAIAGCSKLAAKLAAEIEANPWMGFQLHGFYDDSPSPDTPAERYLGDLQQLTQDARAKRYDQVFIALPMSDEERIRDLVHGLSDSSTPVHFVPDLFVSNLMKAQMSAVGNLPTISVFDSTFDDFGRLLKRLEDIVLSSLILLLISPIMLAIGIAIKATSEGPMFFKQKRYGIGGDEIWVWKFRSMSVTENDPTHIQQAQKNDARITPLGAFIRRTSLDELPQFINVLQGQMSIVGPRPHAVAHNELYRKDIEGYMLRHLVKPGITGWAQVNGWRGETDTLEKMQKRVEYDLAYIRDWSLWLDLKIIFLTIFKGFINKNAY
ncbi:UDP-glucose:undecaprenyl-phosphate glucose-1-phosphate transferase [BD1-7 clade bacterium]|uniref:UDP-glucose:undecaprenyl-phosphate glucose-1-phosphate transferase n=1 Tax=BD1-7 clade bacterium TaxID=2029982 RepID=A0A5S9MYV3_9GAMM|nr:UDP-glucose:undecaprenyl-phosphate glucose-1-phosphate transferase [BD1-7 clade bacterium]CAA0083127.1 UDP-glucose:undecaprenyl-phosphate glucose-1-phosphate transferase [BD1-7 clade bacterium]